MTTITSEDYVEMLKLRLEAVELTASEILTLCRLHKWSKNMGVKDRDALGKIERDLWHIIRYSKIENLQEVDNEI
jgi:hypothetical protein